MLSLGCQDYSSETTPINIHVLLVHYKIETRHESCIFHVNALPVE